MRASDLPLVWRTGTHSRSFSCYSFFLLFAFFYFIEVTLSHWSQKDPEGHQLQHLFQERKIFSIHYWGQHTKWCSIQFSQEGPSGPLLRVLVMAEALGGVSLGKHILWESTLPKAMALVWGSLCPRSVGCSVRGGIRSRSFASLGAISAPGNPISAPTAGQFSFFPCPVLLP